MAPKFILHFQVALLRKSQSSYFFSLRDYHPVKCYFPENFSSKTGYIMYSYNTTSLQKLLNVDSVCPILLSFAITNSISLISFPSVTKTFQFTELVILADLK